MIEASDRKLASAEEVFSVYWQHVRLFPFALTLTIAGSAAIQVSELAAPWFLRKFFNLLAASTPSSAVVRQLIGLLVIVAFLYLASWASRRVQEFSIMYLESRVMSNLFSNAFQYLVGHSYNFFISHFAGSLTHRVSKFARAFETMFDGIMTQFLPTFLFVAGAVAVLYTRNHALGTALGLWSVVFIAFQLYVARLRQPVRAARADADTRVTASLADSISNHATILLFSGERHESGLFRAVVEAWRAATMRSWSTDNAIWAGIGIFMIGIEISLLWGAVALWGEGLVVIGDFVLIQAYLLTTFDRLVNINRELRRFNDAYADASEMVHILNEPHDIYDIPGAKALVVSRAAISFERINFAFHAERPVLKDFNLSIEGGEKVALVGLSGAGKTTITKLLLRLFDITDGRITIDAQDIARVTKESLRGAISFVPQEPILFHRSLMENIRYGRRGASDGEVIEAAKRAHCHEFISALSEGYDTRVGERGVKLSGGERQRVAIARAILKNAPILVLDEATSSLDSQSEAFIQDALETLMLGKTVVVIAHRLSTIMKMDRIIVLDHGAVAAEGTHRELLARGGLYKKLWSIQAGGFRSEPIDEGEVNIDELNGEGDDEKEPPLQGATPK